MGPTGRSLITWPRDSIVKLGREMAVVCGPCGGIDENCLRRHYPGTSILPNGGTRIPLTAALPRHTYAGAHTNLNVPRSSLPSAVHTLI